MTSSKDQMTIMIESSRTFLFTEYARKGCGALSEIGTDPKVWEKMPVSEPPPPSTYDESFNFLAG